MCTNKFSREYFELNELSLKYEGSTHVNISTMTLIFGLDYRIDIERLFESLDCLPDHFNLKRTKGH